MMKLDRLLILCTAVAIGLPQLTSAAPQVPPKELGHVEAIVAFCAEADSESADQYKEWGKKIAQDMSEKELADVRKSKEYKETYKTITDQLKETLKDEATESCRAALDEANSR